MDDADADDDPAAGTVETIDVRADEDLPAGDLADLVALYREYAWWADRDPEDVRRAIEATDLVVALRDGEGRLVAAARVLTDFVYYASVYDVIVGPDRRGEGLGRRLLREVVDHPDLRPDCTRSPGVDLLCREGLVPFYEACGFAVADEEVAHPDGPPERLRRMVYRRESARDGGTRRNGRNGKRVEETKPTDDGDSSPPSRAGLSRRQSRENGEEDGGRASEDGTKAGWDGGADGRE